MQLQLDRYRAHAAGSVDVLAVQQPVCASHTRDMHSCSRACRELSLSVNSHTRLISNFAVHEADANLPCSCVPGLWTREAALIGVQGALLVCRTWLTDFISRIEARAGRHLIAQARRLHILGNICTSMRRCSCNAGRESTSASYAQGLQCGPHRRTGASHGLRRGPLMRSAL